MNEDWLLDGRKIPDDAMGYIRKMAVHAVRERGESPEEVARLFNFNRHCIYRWLRQYDELGYEGLESAMPPGAQPLITGEIDIRLKDIVVNQSPLEFGYDTLLWTSSILAELLKKEFGVEVSNDTVSLHLKALGLTYQKPCYQDKERDSDEIEHFLNDTLPRIQRLAAKLGADIGFEDEAGVGIRTRSGRTWGLKGKAPIIPICNQRGGYNMLSIVTPQGDMRYSLAEGSIDSERFIEFLKHLIKDRKSPLILLIDHASFHRSKAVCDFVRAHRARLRIFFLPKHAPELNPDEQVWNEIKNNKIGKQPVQNKNNLKVRLKSALASLQKNTQRILSFLNYRIFNMRLTNP